MESPISGTKKTIIAKKTVVGTEETQLALMAQCTQDLETSLKSLETSMNNNAGAGDLLSKRIWWLNMILAILSAVGLSVTILQYLKP